jgi:hypothetical protein
VGLCPHTIQLEKARKQYISLDTIIHKTIPGKYQEIADMITNKQIKGTLLEDASLLFFLAKRGTNAQR